MRRAWMTLAALTLVLAACGDSLGGAADRSTTTSGTMVEESAPSTAAGVTPATEAGEPDITSGRSPAPDFTLELGDGGAYSLSEGEKPVYLVFWAEW
ncbi:MAG: hypothetical protein WBZ40_10255 [Acidimicrobiia bacterium]